MGVVFLVDSGGGGGGVSGVGFRIFGVVSIVIMCVVAVAVFLVTVIISFGGEIAVFLPIFLSGLRFFMLVMTSSSGGTSPYPFNR